MKLKHLFETTKPNRPDLKKLSIKQLEKLAAEAEKALENAPEDTTEEAEAEEWVSQIEQEIFRRDDE